MSGNNGLDIEDLLKMSALTSQEQFTEDDDDDDDDESFGGYFGEYDDDDDDESFLSEDDDDERFMLGLSESDDDDDDDESYAGLAERRRRRKHRRRKYRSAGRRRRLSKVRGSKSTTLRSPTGQRMRVRFGKSYATTVEVNKLIKDTERKFSIALKERKTNFDRLSKQIASASNSLESKVRKVSKTVKNLEQKSQSSSMISLLQGPPKIKTIKFDKAITNIEANKDYEAEIDFEKPDMLLPLLLGGGLGGSGAGSDNSLLLMLAFSGKK